MGVGVIVGVGLMVGETVGVGDGLFTTTRRGEIVPQAAMTARILNTHTDIQWLLPPPERKFITKRMPVREVLLPHWNAPNPADYQHRGTREKTRFAQFL